MGLEGDVWTGYNGAGRGHCVTGHNERKKYEFDLSKEEERGVDWL